MASIPCSQRTFLYRIDLSVFCASYLRWFNHLNERVGAQNRLAVWKRAFAHHDDPLLEKILSAEWHRVPAAEATLDDGLASVPLKTRKIIEGTPPIAQIKRHFPRETVERNITAYEVLHLRFDGLARLAETLIELFGKQGELIVYDLMVESRLTSAKDRGTVEEFIEDFTAPPAMPNLFTAGLETELIRKTNRAVVLDVRECEWARYFRERHPTVGYLMACSTDEVAYRAFNKNLRMQRTSTLMEGGEKCDFRIYAIDEVPDDGEAVIC